MVDDGARKKLSPETIAAFDAPYIDESYKTGPRRFPMILPISPDMDSVPENRAAWEYSCRLGQTGADAVQCRLQRHRDGS